MNKRACYAQQMRSIDRLAEAEGAIPSIILMENAAIACVDSLLKEKRDLKNIAVFCGKGNNGGDGFAIARHIANSGLKVTVFLVCGDEFNGDAAVNYDIIEKMGINIESVYNTDMLDYIIPSFDAVIDAIFGTGIHGIIEGIPAEVIDCINKYSKFIMSVDVPSGMDSDTGAICGVCVKADMTVTFAAYKVGMFLFPAADYCGKKVLADISIPDYIIENAKTAAQVLDDEAFAKAFPKRENDSQKGNYGKILIIGGSKGMSGAVYMAGEAVLNSGAGLVTLAVPESINQALEAKTTEVMTAAMRDSSGHLSSMSIPEILNLAEKADVILIGSGMGTSGDCEIILQQLLEKSKVPVVVDADALNILSGNMSILEKCSCPLVFTPHEVEMARLTGVSLDEVRSNRMELSEGFCEKYGVTLILKGHHTVITAPNGLQYINNTGNAGMAKGGSGDMLAGVTAAFLARISDEPLAAAMAVYLHGKCGDCVMEKSGIEAVTAQKMINSIGTVLKYILD